MDNQTEQFYPTNPAMRVGLNPFAHFFYGTRDLFATNAVPAILAVVISILLSYGFAALTTYLLVKYLFTILIGGGSATTSYMAILGFNLLATLIAAFFNSIIIRTVLTGTRREHVSFGSLFPFAAKRYLKVLLCSLFVVLVFIIVFALFVKIAFMGQVPAIVSGLAGFLFLLIFSLRMSYVIYIAVDDEQPPSVRGIIKRSSQLWQKSGGALMLYYLVLFAGFIALIAISRSSQSHGSYGESSLGTSPISGLAAGGIFFGSAIGSAIILGILQLLFSATVGHIYNQAKQVYDGNDFAPAPAAGAPVFLPVAPAEQAAAPVYQAEVAQPVAPQVFAPASAAPVTYVEPVTPTTQQDQPEAGPVFPPTPPANPPSGV